VRIAAQLWTVRQLLREPGSLGAVLSRIRKIGYEGVELLGEFEASAGLVACAAHVSLTEIVADLDAVAARCISWGCKYVVVPSLPAEYHSPEGFRRFAAEAAEIADALRPRGLELAYHNHDFELPIGLDLIFAGGLKAELDTYWLKRGGDDPVAWIQRLSGRVPLVHLKDMSAEGGQTEVGLGVLDWPAILAACRDSGTEWLVVEQDETDGDPLKSLEISYRNLTGLLAG